MSKAFDKLTERYISDTFGEDSQCWGCKHFRGGVWCDAFPKGKGSIPGAIYENEHDHTEPYPGDNGIQFEAK